MNDETLDSSSGVITRHLPIVYPQALFTGNSFESFVNVSLF